MWWLVSALFSTGVGFVLNNITREPAVQIVNPAPSQDEQKYYKVGFFVLTGALALILFKKYAK